MKHPKIHAINVETGEQKFFKSLGEASKGLDCHISLICKVLAKGDAYRHYKTAKGWSLCRMDDLLPEVSE